eukprot:m.10144 g.10144  ORF g.10144 m.10144 type:complete len:99 (-) comp7346_c0_seq1:89-385(-)
MQKESGLWCDVLGNWLNLDGLLQATTPTYQRDQGKVACTGYLTVAEPLLNNETYVLTHLTLPGTHTLPGVVGAVAECAKWYPDLVQTQRPWKCCAPFP